jgi:DNA-binding NarL/FixJ family response regulator
MESSISPGPIRSPSSGEDAATHGTSRKTVIFADDHRLFRQGLARTISSHHELELVAQASDGLGALSLIEELEPDVALADLKMRGLDGIEVCARLTSQRLHTRVVLLSAFVGPQLVGAAVEAGADGYLAKDTSPEEICYALVEVARGGGGAFGKRGHVHARSRRAI